MEKVAVSGFDIKRRVLADNITTLPHGYIDVSDVFDDSDIDIYTDETATLPITIS